MKKYFKYIKPYWILFLLSPSLMMVEVYCDVTIPLLAGMVVNEGVSNGDVSKVVELLVKMMMYLLLSASAGIGASFCASKASLNFACDLREDIFIKIQKFSFANIDKFTAGSLVTRMTNDISQLQQLVAISLRMAFRAPGMLIGAVIMAYSINKELSMVFVVLIPILALIIYVILSLSHKKFAILQTKVDDMNSSIRESFINVRIIKSLARENYEIDKVNKVNKDLKDTGLSAYRINILQMPLMTLVVNMATIAIVYFGGIGIENESMQIGDITSFITYLTQILMSINMLAMVFLQWSRGIASSNRVSEVLLAKVDLTDDNCKKPEKKVLSGNIEFKDVCFRYYKDNEEHVLTKINVDIKSGETVGIVGSTGCGKTSFVQLIPRLYEADSGSVMVDGADVKDYTFDNLREGISMVLQNNMLFSGTIKENMLWGDTSAEHSELEQVADWSAAQEFISELPKQYETMLGQAGVNLSGGQKQRLCIARALLKKPKILILDDSTSAVDTKTESKIKSHLSNDLDGITKIIIAQRISSVIDADKIIVMNNGVIEAIGVHTDLLESCKTYTEIYSSQMNKEVMIGE